MQLIVTACFRALVLQLIFASLTMAEAQDDLVGSQLWRAVRIVQEVSKDNYTRIGSGFILVRNHRMVVFTNAHVVANAPRPIWFLWEGRPIDTTVRSIDQNHDLAMLNTNAQLVDADSVTRERTAAVVVGDKLVAFGYPDTVAWGSAGSESSPPARIVGQVIAVGHYAPAIQTLLLAVGAYNGPTFPAFVFDAKGCTTGASGGPLFNSSGAIVGYLKGMVNEGGCIGVAIGRAIGMIGK